jgi:hypothetical protein
VTPEHKFNIRKTPFQHISFVRAEWPTCNWKGHKVMGPERGGSQCPWPHKSSPQTFLEGALGEPISIKISNK